ncbi:MAG: response regulator [Bacteroidales bacterium]|nr:response regulator [Bacteroidales bacterium]
MRSLKVSMLLFFMLWNVSGVYSSDTIYISRQTSRINVYEYIEYYEDSLNIHTIDSFLDPLNNFAFRDNESHDRFSFAFSTSTFWIKLIVKSVSDQPVNYIFEILNPDLDHLKYYETKGSTITKKVETGELYDVKTRDLMHRNFLFSLDLNPGEAKIIYISANNGGHSFFVPIRLTETDVFRRQDNKIEILYWLIYGILIFIILFNVYLYRITKDKVNLYYFMYVFFATITLFTYDGYMYFFNPPVFVEKIKWIMPSMYIVFLLSFTQSFTSYNKKLSRFRKLLNPVKVIAVVAVVFYSFRYPFSLVADIGISFLILASLVVIIVISALAYRKDYSPSVFLLFAYFAIFVGFLILMLKEQNLLSSSFLVENSSKFGQTIECILLTVAVLERFRINQENARQTIHDNLEKIELQNKELEIINTELEKLSIVASETDNSIAIYDDMGKIEWANTGFEKLYDVKLNELIKEHHDRIEDIIPNKNIRLYIDKCLQTKLPVMFETTVVTSDREKIWIQTTLSPYIRSEKIHKIIAIDSDITSLKIYEKELETAKERAVESDRLKTTFLGNLSHEIRTPLNGILGFSELLNRNELNREERKVYLDIIKSSGEQLMHIIDDIVDISLIESNQLKMYPAQFDLASLIQEVVEFFEGYKSTIGKSHVKLLNDMKIGEDTYMIVSDSFRLRQVLTNLIKNAFKFTNEGHIRIRTYYKDHFLYFCVEDTGIGITPEVKDVIFERFRQGEESLSRKYGGTGLGLSISKGIVEKLGGEIWIDPGYKSGFKISFTIPHVVAGKPLTAVPKQYTSEGIGEKIRNKDILIVEDHTVSYKYLEEILHPFNPRLFRAFNGEEAVELVRANHYDLIIMDINLPAMDGITATKKIRDISPEVPVFVQTAFAMKSEIKKIMSSGCNDMIGKPFSKKEFFEKLVKVL